MQIEISGGQSEDGVVVGNTFDKYGSHNPIVRLMMMGFNSAISQWIKRVDPRSIHEVGCGEGYWVTHWTNLGIPVRGSDFSNKVITKAKTNALHNGISEKIFRVQSIYDLESGNDSAHTVVCCEVLEHLERPEDALLSLQRITEEYLIISVPREPLWCILNLVRGKYISTMGNTPGHIQHWTLSGFIQLVNQYFEIVEIRTPIPWVMLLCRSRH